jgi:hypothetical protein
MTSSARARIDGGISMPMARAILRLITSSNRVGEIDVLRQPCAPRAAVLHGNYPPV